MRPPGQRVASSERTYHSIDTPPAIVQALLGDLKPASTRPGGWILGSIRDFFHPNADGALRDAMSAGVLEVSWNMLRRRTLWLESMTLLSAVESGPVPR
jgi:hypothetical protein